MSKKIPDELLKYVNASPLDEEDLRVLQELAAEDAVIIGPDDDSNGDGARYGARGGYANVPDAVGGETTGEITDRNTFTPFQARLVRVTMIAMLVILTLFFVCLAIAAFADASARA